MLDAMSAVGPSQIDVVVFDLDGTLVDSSRDLAAATPAHRDRYVDLLGDDAAVVPGRVPRRRRAGPARGRSSASPWSSCPLVAAGLAVLGRVGRRRA